MRKYTVLEACVRMAKRVNDICPHEIPTVAYTYVAIVA